MIPPGTKISPVPNNLYCAEAVASIVHRYWHIMAHKKGLASNDVSTGRTFAESMLSVIKRYREDVPEEIQKLIDFENLGELEQKCKKVLCG